MDNSFFRFTDNFNEAKDLQNSKLADFDYDMQIHLKPGESYSCITNCPNGIGFGGVYKMYIVDVDNKILADITNKAYIEEFTDNTFGRQQLKLELLGITGYDFYTDIVFFRLDHNIIGGKKYWTNPFLFSNYDIEETTKFRFKNYIDLDGTNYKIASIFQSVRLKCYKEKTSFTSSSQSYTTFQGNKHSSRVIKTKTHDYIFDLCNDFIYDRLQFLFTHDVIYADTIRVTDKQTFENQSKLGSSNVTQLKYKLSVDINDIDDEAYQVFKAPVQQVAPVDYIAKDYNINDYKTT